jgi:hypothetical protein
MLLSTIVMAPLDNLALGTVPMTFVVGKLLKLVLTVNSDLKTTSFGFAKGHTDDVWKALVSNVLAGLSANSSLRWLGMDHFPCVCLDTATWNGKDRKQTRALRELMLRSNRLQWTVAPAILQAFPSVTNLSRWITQEHEGPCNLASLLRMKEEQEDLGMSNHVWFREKVEPRGHRFQTIANALQQEAPITHLAGFGIPRQEGIEAKAQNKRLELIEEEANTTLTHIQVCAKPFRRVKLDPKLWYFLGLNLCFVRSNLTSKEAFVGLLRQVPNKLRYFLEDLSTNSVLFGLLLEKPELWAI